MPEQVPYELGDVEADGTDASEHVFFTRGRIAVKLESERSGIVAALSRDAADKLLERLAAARGRRLDA